MNIIINLVMTNLCKFLLVMAMSVAAMSANAGCTLFSTKDISVTKALKAHGGFTAENFETVCEKLKRADAAILIIGTAAVLNNQSIGWAAVMVKDKNSNIMTSDFANYSTFVNGYASQDKADELMVVALNDALDKWTGLDEALASLDRQRKKVLQSRSR